MEWNKDGSKVCLSAVRLACALTFLASLYALPTRAAEKDSHELAEDLLRQGQTKIDSKEYPEAVAIYGKILGEELVKSPSGRLDALYGRGSAQLELHNYNKAIEDFTAALEILYRFNGDTSSKKSAIHFARARAYDELGHLEKAVDDYTKCIVLDSDFPRAYNNRAVAYYKLKNYQEAISDTNQYLKRDQNWPEAYYVRGISKIELRDRSGITDLKIAAGMGHKYAQEALRQAGIDWP
jgi:tetratricopeptide (TPR) repeat protein